MDEPVFVVLTISGKVWRKPTETGYFGLLRDVYVEMQGSGSNWDAPWRLLMNGEMVIPEKLKDIAWEYCRADDEARWAAAKKVREAHRPIWLLKATEGAV
jgi:hypothetical protein